MKVKRTDFLIFFALLFISFSPIAIDTDTLKNYSYFWFLAQIVLVTMVKYRQGNLIHFFTPASIAFLYVCIAFLIASYTYPKGYVYEIGDLEGFWLWENYNRTLSYVLMCGNVLFFVDYIQRKKLDDLYSIPRIKLDNDAIRTYMFIAIVFFFTFSFIPLDIEFLGGSGDVAMIPKTIATLTLIYILSIKEVRFRYAIYFLILILFSSFSYGSKREAIFLISSMALIEVISKKIEPKLKHVLILIAIAIISVFLILVMSLMRGYGGYIAEGDSVSFFQTLGYLGDYISNDLFVVYFFNNLEVNATYFHSINGMEYVINDKSLIDFGGTIFKVLFILIPSSILDVKPDSIIHLYTITKDPVYRSIGGSWPINIYAEYFWNFYYFGFIFLGLFYYIFNALFIMAFKLIRDGRALFVIWILYAYMESITLARGSGLDMYAVYMCFASFFSLVFYTLYKLLSLRKISTS
ncbi:hypothetical protein [Enterovibrio calviensis]|uniref:hypothetical protein n=1 Tax=Enterovibrio calviensis TaxID=91359 RepID=UPI00373507A7